VHQAKGFAGGSARSIPLDAIRRAVSHHPCCLVRAPEEGSFGPAIHLFVWNTVHAGGLVADGYTILSGAGGSHKRRPEV